MSLLAKTKVRKRTSQRTTISDTPVSRKGIRKGHIYQGFIGDVEWTVRQWTEFKKTVPKMFTSRVDGDILIFSKVDGSIPQLIAEVYSEDVV